MTGDPSADYESVASSAWAAGSLISTTHDLSAFITALFDDRLISEEGLAAMTDIGSGGYGLGLFAASLGPGEDGYAHSGGIPGYTSTMGIAPDSSDVIVILTNNDALIADLLAPLILQSW